MSARTTQIANHTFQHEPWAALALGIRMDDLAARNGLSVDIWEEDGLGEAKGCFLQLGTGRVILLRELTHAVEHLGEVGPSVYVDAADLAVNGPEPILNEVVYSLGLSETDVIRKADADVLASAKQFVADINSRKAGI